MVEFFHVFLSIFSWWEADPTSHDGRYLKGKDFRRQKETEEELGMEIDLWHLD